MKKTTITIKDVARLAGVSPSTVSRVISGNPIISQPTTNKVLEAMDELGYYPNAIARSLASQKTGIIGIVLPSRIDDVFLNPFFPEALAGIAKSASRGGYDILFSTNILKTDDLATIKNFTGGSKVDGIILLSSKTDDKCVDYLKSIDFPFVLIGTPSKSKNEINYVDNDNVKAAYQLTKHLLYQGKRSLLMIAGDKDLTVTQNRVKGFKKALKEEGIDFNEKDLLLGSFEEETGYKYGSEILQLDKWPDGIIVTDDLVAFGLVKKLLEENVNIPKDICVASFNNSIFSRLSNPPLTSVDIDAYKLGKEATRLLISLLKGDRARKKIIVGHELYIRESTKE